MNEILVQVRSSLILQIFPCTFSGNLVKVKITKSNPQSFLAQFGRVDQEEKNVEWHRPGTDWDLPVILAKTCHAHASPSFPLRRLCVATIFSLAICCRNEGDFCCLLATWWEIISCIIESRLLNYYLAIIGAAIIGVCFNWKHMWLSPKLLEMAHTQRAG